MGVPYGQMAERRVIYKFFLNSDYMNDNLSENRPRSTKRSIKSRAAVLGLGINQNILEQLCEDSNDQKYS